VVAFCVRTRLHVSIKIQKSRYSKNEYRTLSNQHKLEVSLIENLQRRDLNPLETATAYLKLRDQFNLTLDQIGQRVGGKSVAAISNTLRLLRLPAAVREAIVEGKLSEGQARPLISLDEDLVEKILPKILSEDWSARTIEQYAAQLKASGETKLTKPVQVNDHKYTQTVGFLTKQLNTPVRVKTNAKGSGQIVITFKNYKDLARIGKLLER
jgi:ParB family chromosome partitioning protein